MPLVADDFDVPAGLETERFRLRMLSMRDAVPDFEAMHDRVDPTGKKEFQLRRAFAYTVVAWEAGLDAELDQAVRAWIEERWPFATAVYPRRDG